MDPRTQNRLIETAKHAAMILICLMALFPILWILTQAFKSYFDTIAVPPKIFFKPVLDNFRQVLAKPGFLSSLKDSLIMALGSSVLGLILGTPCGYALARLTLPGGGVGRLFPAHHPDGLAHRHHHSPEPGLPDTRAHRHAYRPDPRPYLHQHRAGRVDDAGVLSRTSRKASKRRRGSTAAPTSRRSIKSPCP